MRAPRVTLLWLCLGLLAAVGCSEGTADSTVPLTAATTVTSASSATDAIASTTTVTTPAPTTSAAETTTSTTVGVPPRYVVTHFFYWYDPATGRHITDDPMTLSLPDGALPDWRDPGWFEREFADMVEAGIDIAACEYWPGETWSDSALVNLVAALDALSEQGIDPPAVAMFYDTVPLWGWDLDSAQGREYLFSFPERFYAAVPERHWGRIDERPVVWFYNTGGENISSYSQATFDDFSTRFAARFGVRPYIVLDSNWPAGQPVTADAIYTWGVAFLGFQPRDTVAGVGPGYDDSQVLGRDPIVVPREDGNYYRRSLYYALASGRDILWLETWNEHHEATNINHTAEFGREYIDITREHVTLFRQGLVPSRPDLGEYAGASRVSAEITGGEGLFAGLTLLPPYGDGLWEIVEAAGVPAWRTAGDAPGRYLYFDIDEGFAFFDTPVSVQIEVEFLDSGGGRLLLEYDSYKPGVPDRLEDRYRPEVMAAIGNSGAWRTAAVRLSDVRFANGQNWGMDFRLSADENHNLSVRRVTLIRVGG